MPSQRLAEAEQRIKQAFQTNATTLDLSYLELDNVPASIGKLANLTLLDLSENQLTTLPSDLGKLSNLTMLDLRDRQRTRVNSQFRQMLQC